MVWVCLTSANTGEFFRINFFFKPGKSLEENLVKSALHQTLEDECTFQQDNSLQHKAKSTLELLTKKTVNVPEWTSYGVVLNLLANLWQGFNISA
jgi:hypothetical protein